MRLITVKEAAEIMHVHPETIRRWCRMGKLLYKFNSKREGYMIDWDSLSWDKFRPDGYYTDTTGGRLRKLRKELGFTSLSVAFAIGMDPHNLSMIENNKKNMSISDLKRLCRFYNVSADYVLCMDLMEGTYERN